MNLLKETWSATEIGQKARLYEMVRKLNPRHFSTICDANRRGAGSFDDIVGRIASAYESDQSMYVGCAVVIGVGET